MACLDVTSQVMAHCLGMSGGSGLTGLWIAMVATRWTALAAHTDGSGVPENEIGMSSSSLELRPSFGGSADAESSPLFDPSTQGPIRADLLGLERLEGRARRLAEACGLAPRRR